MNGRTPGVYKRGVNGRWWITYYQHGERIREPAGRSHKDAAKLRAQRVTDIEAGRAGLRSRRKPPTLRVFVEETWRPNAVHLKPATREGYDKLLRNHLLPTFGDRPLTAITREAVKQFIAQKSQEKRHSYSEKNPNPNRPLRARKSIRNMAGLLSSLLESAAVDYGLLGSNPLRGILRRKHLPADAHRIKDRRARFLEPEPFKRAVEHLAAKHPHVADMVLVAALSGLRWGELVALRRIEDVDFRHNKIRVTRALYNRIPQTPKSEGSVGDVDMCPTVRRILQAARQDGYAFSKDGQAPIGSGSWIKRQWRKSQVAVGIAQPISWHDLRHEFVSLLIAAGKHHKYVALQARHHSAGFTLDRYAHLFDTLQVSAVEWWDDLLWPNGFPTSWAQFGHKVAGTRAETRVPA